MKNKAKKGTVTLELKPELNYRLFSNSYTFFFRFLKSKNNNNKPIRRITRIIIVSTGNVVNSNPLLSGTPSPELGADPGLIVAVVAQNMLEKTKAVL
ncbi:MAG: hypothetical protein NWF10_02195 [Candidatus Bathyarchaeota archaeon]|nr:hypothetical protein [Candidatus Bathyarchaeota archaeon]